MSKRRKAIPNWDRGSERVSAELPKVRGRSPARLASRSEAGEKRERETT